MNNFHPKKIFIGRDDLLHNTNCDTFAELLMLLDETV